MVTILLGVVFALLGLLVYYNSREALRKTTIVWNRLVSLEHDVKSLRATVEEVQRRLRRDTRNVIDSYSQGRLG
jgi:hypothetical protein